MRDASGRVIDGLTPRFIHEETRLEEIRAAIERYMAHLAPIPNDWIEEYNELAKKRSNVMWGPK